MTGSHKIWVDQCEAARDIKEAFGLDKALGYLIGEKLLDFMRVADRDPQFAAELPAFIDAIRDTFEPPDISDGLSPVLGRDSRST